MLEHAPAGGRTPRRARAAGAVERIPSSRSRGVLALQATVGNRAVQRVLAPARADHIADEAYEAMDGLGTDEDRIRNAFRGVANSDVPVVAARYRARHGEDLMADLRDELSEADFNSVPALRPQGPDAVAYELATAMGGVGTDEGRIYRALSGLPHAELPSVVAAYRARTGRSLEADLRDELTQAEFRRLPVFQAVGLDATAQQLHDAMEGAGTDESAIAAALAGRTPQELTQIEASYRRQFGVDLMADLRDDLSDAELAQIAVLAPRMQAVAGAAPGAMAADPRAAARGVAVQLRDALEGAGTDESAVMAALANRTAAQRSAITIEYQALTGRSLEGDLRDDLSGDELQRALGALGIAAQVEERDTELGGLVFGNFDMDLAANKVTVTVRYRFRYAAEMTTEERIAVSDAFTNAVARHWHRPNMELVAEGPAPAPRVPIEINAVLDLQQPHKVIDVANEDRRPHVMAEVNVWKKTDELTFAHEFGHVLGLCDEYDGGMLENAMFWHENRTDDPEGLMNGSGTQQRPRYFEMLRQRVQAVAPPGVVYHVRPTGGLP